MTNNTKEMPQETRSKKLKKKKSKQSKDVDDEDAFLEAIIAENSKISAQLPSVDHAEIIVNLFEKRFKMIEDSWDPVNKKGLKVK